MKPATWRAAVTRHLLPQLPGDWAVSRDLAYRRPVDWILTGIGMASSQYGGSFWHELVVQPLFVPLRGWMPLGVRLGDDFTIEVLADILQREGRKQVKGVMRMQSIIAGIGNAYSDEILHAARMSPFKPASSLLETEDDTDLVILYDAIRVTLGDAVERSRGLAASELKSEKKSNLAVHAQTGKPCPVCGDIVREVSFADSSLQYCPTCQTGGKPLADRRMSRLLK